MDIDFIYRREVREECGYGFYEIRLIFGQSLPSSANGCKLGSRAQISN